MKQTSASSPVLLCIMLMASASFFAAADITDKCCLCPGSAGCDGTVQKDWTATAADGKNECAQVAADLLSSDMGALEPACQQTQEQYQLRCCLDVETSSEPTANNKLVAEKRRGLRSLAWNAGSWKPSGGSNMITNSYSSWSSTQKPLFPQNTGGISLSNFPLSTLSSLFNNFGSTSPRPPPTPPQWNNFFGNNNNNPRPPQPVAPRPPAPRPQPGPRPAQPGPSFTSWGGNNNPIFPQPGPAPVTNWGSNNNAATPSIPSSPSAQQWVNEHNTRRRQYHSQGGVSYVPVKWSNDLANSATTYTNRLLNGQSGCRIQHGFQGDKYGGENLAMQITQTAQATTPATVLRMWYEEEQGLPYPQNGHLTQVAWRGTKYIGCATASKRVSNGYCHIQTCRYLAPGNCNGVGSILAETTPCGPACPKEGCS